MKINKKEIKILLVIMIVFLISPFAVGASNGLLILEPCSAILGQGVAEVLEYVYAIMRIATPILVIGLTTMDFVKAVAAVKDDDMRKAQSTAIKRIIIGVVIMFIPTIVNLILWLIGRTNSTCTFG